MSKKIISLSERIELFRHTTTENKDGELVKNYESIGMFWACVKPLKPNEIRPLRGSGTCPIDRYGESYRLIMRKIHTRHTLHACLTRLIWNHKILEIVSDWMHNHSPHYIEAIAVNTQEESHG